jgi:hypothetical protein
MNCCKTINGQPVLESLGNLPIRLHHSASSNRKKVMEEFIDVPFVYMSDCIYWTGLKDSATTCEFYVLIKCLFVNIFFTLIRCLKLIYAYWEEVYLTRYLSVSQG